MGLDLNCLAHDQDLNEDIGMLEGVPQARAYTMPPLPAHERSTRTESYERYNIFLYDLSPVSLSRFKLGSEYRTAETNLGNTNM